MQEEGDKIVASLLPLLLCFGVRYGKEDGGHSGLATPIVERLKIVTISDKKIADIIIRIGHAMP